MQAVGRRDSRRRLLDRQCEPYPEPGAPRIGPPRVCLGGAQQKCVVQVLGGAHDPMELGAVGHAPGVDDGFDHGGLRSGVG